MTITELVVSVILMSVTFAAIGELVVLNSYASTKLTNTVDGEVGCSRAIRRISEDVRSARIIGNIYAPYGSQNQFPSGAGVDPYNTVPPIGGWPPSWPQAPPADPYKLGPQTLILQLPVYYQDPTNQNNPLNGVPLILPASSLVPAPPTPSSALEYVDTVVYQIVPDPVNVGTYQLQVARFAANIVNPPIVQNMLPVNQLYNISGVPNSLLRSPLNPPQTVLVGIVGPMNPADGTNQPSIFQYLTSPVGVPTVVPPPPITAPPPQIVGVSINVEVQVPANNKGTNVHIAPAHVESYMRASQYLKQTNF